MRMDQEDPPEEREKLERLIHEERLRNQGTATPVAGDDMDVDDVGDTHVPSATFVTPEVRTTQLPPGPAFRRVRMIWPGGPRMG